MKIADAIRQIDKEHEDWFAQNYHHMTGEEFQSVSRSFIERRQALIDFAPVIGWGVIHAALQLDRIPIKDNLARPTTYATRGEAERECQRLSELPGGERYMPVQVIDIEAEYNPV